MKKPVIALLFCALALTSTAAPAQKPVRVRGTIAAFDGGVLSVKARDGKRARVHISEKTVIVFTQPISLSDIKAGDFLGVTSRKDKDGTLTAVEVRRFPKPVNPGHRPFGGEPDATMTNATVATTVQSARGRELTLTYPGGSQMIRVPDAAAISMLVPGNPAQLVVGAPVNLSATAADGSLTAIRVQVGGKPAP